MSRIMQSTVAGIALTLTLGATAATARPLYRAAGKAAPTRTEGFIESVRAWWNDLAARVIPTGRGGLSALSGKAGSQMDPNGGISEVPDQRSPTLVRSPGL
jgi:hypothetical protein